MRNLLLYHILVQKDVVWHIDIYQLVRKFNGLWTSISSKRKIVSHFHQPKTTTKLICSKSCFPVRVTRPFQNDWAEKFFWHFQERNFYSNFKVIAYWAVRPIDSFYKASRCVLIVNQKSETLLKKSLRINYVYIVYFLLFLIFCLQSFWYTKILHKLICLRFTGFCQYVFACVNRFMRYAQWKRTVSNWQLKKVIFMM